MTEDIFYSCERFKRMFALNFCFEGDRIPHAEEVLVAKYEGQGDGYDVEVYVWAAPATAYTIKALATPDSVGEGFTITTGTGIGSWVAETAKLISEGMVGIK